MAYLSPSAIPESAEGRLSAPLIVSKKSSSFLSSYLSAYSPSPETSCTHSPRDTRKLSDAVFEFLHELSDPSKRFQLRNLDSGEALDLRNECFSSFPQELCSLLSLRSPQNYFTFLSKRRENLQRVWAACVENDLSKVKLLLDSADFNPAARTTHGWTVLHIAAAGGAMDVCSFLISSFSELDVNCRTESGLTPMHLAAMNGSIGTLKVLFKADGDLNAVDMAGFTPLHYAAAKGRDEVVRYFVSHGADLRAESNTLRLPADVAATVSARKRLRESCENYTRIWLENIQLRNSREDAVNRFLSHIPRRILYQPIEASYRDFQPVRFLGKGGFGSVYVVKEVKSGKYYALKSMKKSRILKQKLLTYAFTERNVLILSEGHPFIGQLIYAFQTPSQLILVLDYYPNGSFSEYLSVQKKLSEDVARTYAAELFLALEFLHQHDIIYRDLKPDNIVFDRDGHLRLIDFGLAKEDFLTHSSSFCGTLNYLAPEMIQHKPHDLSLDWYMFGCILYEMIVGKPPFVARHVKEILNLIEQSVITFPACMSDEAMDLIQELMKSDPKQRLGAKGGAAIKAHAFFQGVDWKSIYERRGEVPQHAQKLMRTSSIVPQIQVYGDLKKLPCPIPGWTFTRPT